MTQTITLPYRKMRLGEALIMVTGVTQVEVLSSIEYKHAYGTLLQCVGHPTKMNGMLSETGTSKLDGKRAYVSDVRSCSFNVIVYDLLHQLLCEEDFCDG